MIYFEFEFSIKWSFQNLFFPIKSTLYGRNLENSSWKILEKKQPFRGALRKRCPENVQHIYRRTPMSKCDFSNVACKLDWNRTSTWVFFCKFNDYFQKNFSKEQLWRAASAWRKLETPHRKKIDLKCPTFDDLDKMLKSKEKHIEIAVTITYFTFQNIKTKNGMK